MLTALHRAPQGPSSVTSGLSVVSLSYHADDVVIDELDLHVGPSELVVVIADDDDHRGTLIDLLRGAVTPHDGTITINGVELGDLPYRDRPRVVGPDHVQPPAATIRRALARQSAALDLLGSLPELGDGSDDDDDLRPAVLRRLALTLAVEDNPDLLLLDEPTHDVEGAEERQLIRVIEAACYGRSAVVFTHRLSLARKADRVLVLESGRLSPFRAYGANNHADRWHTRIPPICEPDSSLRLVRPNEKGPVVPQRVDGSNPLGHLVDQRFRLRALIGRTAVTETWVAHDEEHNQTVKLKLPRHLDLDQALTTNRCAPRPTAKPTEAADPALQFVSHQAWEQLRRERDALQDLRHPGISQVVAASVDGDIPYVAFDYLDGPSLADALAVNPYGLDLTEVLYLGFEVAEILHQLHRRNQVHLNLRTGHLHQRGSAVVLTDFAQCRPIGMPLPPRRRPVASPRPRRGPGSLRPLRHYAPELQPGRKADPKMDVYALGVLLRKAACGPSATALLPFGHIRPDAPPPVARLVDSMTAIDPSERPDGPTIMTELRRAVPAPASPPRLSTPPPRAPQLRLVAAAQA